MICQTDRSVKDHCIQQEEETIADWVSREKELYDDPETELFQTATSRNPALGDSVGRVYGKLWKLTRIYKFYKCKMKCITHDRDISLAIVWPRLRRWVKRNRVATINHPAMLQEHTEKIIVNNLSEMLTTSIHIVVCCMQIDPIIEPITTFTIFYAQMYATGKSLLIKWKVIVVLNMPIILIQYISTRWSRKNWI